MTGREHRPTRNPTGLWLLNELSSLLRENTHKPQEGEARCDSWAGTGFPPQTPTASFGSLARHFHAIATCFYVIIEQTPASPLASKLHEVKTTSDLLTGYRSTLYHTQHRVETQKPRMSG